MRKHILAALLVVAVLVVILMGTSTVAMAAEDIPLKTGMEPVPDGSGYFGKPDNVGNPPEQFRPVVDSVVSIDDRTDANNSVIRWGIFLGTIALALVGTWLVKCNKKFFEEFFGAFFYEVAPVIAAIIVIGTFIRGITWFELMEDNIVFWSLRLITLYLIPIVSAIGTIGSCQYALRVTRKMNQ